MAGYKNKHNGQGIVTSVTDADYVVVNKTASPLLENITVANLRTAIASGIALIEKIVSNEATIALFAAASAGYTYQQGDIIVVTNGTLVTLYMYVGGTKTDVANYLQIDVDEIEWNSILNKPFTISAASPTVNDDVTLGITIGWVWVNAATGSIFTCTDATDGAAAWVEILSKTRGDALYAAIGSINATFASNAEVLAKTVANKVVSPATIDGGVKRYKALLSQSGVNAPTAIVLENTIGAIVWSRDDVGVYYGTLAGVFAVDKTFFTMPYQLDTLESNRYSLNRTSADAMIITCTDGTIEADGSFTNLPILIEVYP